MNSFPPSRPHLFGLLAGLFLASGLCFSSIILARTWTHLRESQVIDVTGSARKNIRSDLAIWKCQFTVEDDSLGGANGKLKDALSKAEVFFRSHGSFTPQFAPVQIHEIRSRGKNDDDAAAGRLMGYQLVQQIEIASSDVDGILRLSRESADLLGAGIAMASSGIDFIYTKASDAKVEMMAEATKDARIRADQIASQGSRHVKELRSAHMGVVQINPLYSTATSWEGNNDTSSLDKTITATVNATFGLE